MKVSNKGHVKIVENVQIFAHKDVLLRVRNCNGIVRNKTFLQ